MGIATKISSLIMPVASTITISDLPLSSPHCFVGFEFFADIDGEIYATPTGGTIVITVKTISTPQFEQGTTNGTVDATAPHDVTYAANAKEVIATPSGISGPADYWRVNISANRT